ncbi:MAG: SDR family NAD(P)-dependent oxidoreductase [Acidimicrobiales bacterium]
MWLTLRWASIEACTWGILAPKTVLITGTSSGIGAACVARQAEAGWRVYTGVRNDADGERLSDPG